MVRVDDILFGGNASFIRTLMTEAIKFRAGELETITCKSHITAAGLRIGKWPGGALLSPQQPYVDGLPKMEVDLYVPIDRISNARKLGGTFRQ